MLGSLGGVLTKFSQVIPQRILPKQLILKRKKSFWIWAAITYLLIVILMFMLMKLSFSGRLLLERAIAGGQQITLNMVSGEVEGKLHVQVNEKSPELQLAIPATPPPPNKEGLTPVPFPELIEQTDKGVLPISGRNGVMPWKYYARPYATKEKRPVVAIILTDLGLSRTETDEALKLPHDFTLSFSPYANDTDKWAVKARREGFESIIDLPMQTEDYPFSDPGFFGLMEDLSPDENVVRMHNVLREYPGFVGTLAPANDKMTANRDLIRPYLSELKKRGLLLIYVKTAKNAPLEEFAKANTFYILGVDKIIDDEGARGYVENALQSLVETAKTQGYAIGIAHSYPTTMDVLQSWSENLKSEGVDLVPVSAIGNKMYP